MERPIEQFLDLYWQEIDKVQVAQAYDPSWGDYMRSGSLRFVSWLYGNPDWWKIQRHRKPEPRL